MKNSLPIYEVVPQILQELDENSRIVVQAPPGAGKTTALPLEFLSQSWLGKGRIIMLEPRRIAARSAAYWMARSLGEKVGERVGYSVHLDRKVSENTIIEVVTEGVFINRLVNDPELSGVSMVIFDEFHERSLDADLALALVKESQEILREDLKILVMSATLDAGPVAAFLDDATVITSEGKSYPVEIRYMGDPHKDLISHVSRSIVEAVNNEMGSILVFLPGVGEIKRVQSALEGKIPEDIPVLPLYGALSREKQEAAIEPVKEGLRKIVLATSIAESSITIKGIRVVIDSGLMRKPRFDPRTGMDSLETLYVSKASADQRTGRAGRIESGISYRLWSDYRKLDDYSEPGIAIEDLSSLALTLSRWGYSHYKSLEWLTEPNDQTFNNSRELLFDLGAIDSKGITDKGMRISGLPLHPRLGAMVMAGEKIGCRSLASELAALLSEKDILRYDRESHQSDILYRLEALAGKHIFNGSADKQAMKRVREYARSIDGKTDNRDSGPAGTLLLSAYPDRIAMKIGDGLYHLSNGSNATISERDSLANEEYLVIPSLGGTGKIARIFMACRITEKEIYNELKNRMTWIETLDFDKEKKRFSALRILKLGHLALKKERIGKIPEKRFTKALCDYLKSHGLSDLNWTREALRFRDRVTFLHSLGLENYPDFDEKTLRENLSWLLPYLGGITLKSPLTAIPLLDALKGILDWKLMKEMDELAPTHLTVPSGSRIPIDYSEKEPVLKVRLQELFGMIDTPRLCKGKHPLTIHLLSPASRPIQITKDLKSFWDNTYSEVKKDLKGRYPKHFWPDDPYQAIATNRTKKRM